MAQQVQIEQLLKVLAQKCRELEALKGMIGLSFLELAKHMRPTPNELDTRAIACSGLVRLECIANDDAFVTTHEFHEGTLAFVVFDLMAHDLGSGDAPHLPWLAVTIESLPTCLVEPDDWFCKRGLEQRFDGWLQLPSDDFH